MFKKSKINVAACYQPHCKHSWKTVEDAPISFFRMLPKDNFFFYSGATVDVISTKRISTFQASAIAQISTKQTMVGVVKCKNKYKEEDEEEFYGFFFPFKFVGLCFLHI